MWVRDRAIKQFHEKGGLALLTATAIAPTTVQAANFTVDTLSDVDSDGQTLREVIAVANISSAADTISFAPGLSGTLALTQGELAIDSDLTIVGPDDGITISGEGQSRIFNVSAVAASLSNLTLTEGSSAEGGAILATESTLSLTNCKIQSNSASGNGGGISANESILSLMNSELSGNASGSRGGGLHAGATSNDGSSLTLSDCLISDNTAINNAGAASNGGGISTLNVDTVLVDDCLLTGNYSGGSRFSAGIGGGMAIDSAAELIVKGCNFSDNNSKFFGGALSSQYSDFISINDSTFSESESGIAGALGFYGIGDAELTNCTLVSNQTSSGGGGAIYSRGADTFAVSSCSITGNISGRIGGGIYFANTPMDLANSLIAFNDAASSGPDIGSAGSSSLTLLSPNLFSELDASLTDPDQIIETEPANVFASTSETNGITTGTLADNGGSVPTILILQGGAAENAGLNTALTIDTQDLDDDGDITEALPVDARGYPRIAATTVDLGAVEFTSEFDFVASALELLAEGFNVDGSFSLTFDGDTQIQEGQVLVLSRATDLESFTPIFTFDGTSVFLQETGDLYSQSMDDNSYTVTDTTPPSPKAFYKLEITSE